MQTYEYAVVHMTLDGQSQHPDAPYLYDWAYGCNADLADIAWIASVEWGGVNRQRLAHPAIVAGHLGQRGWEPFHVGQTADNARVYLQYHFRRSSEDKPIRD